MTWVWSWVVCFAGPNIVVDCLLYGGMPFSCRAVCTAGAGCRIFFFMSLEFVRTMWLALHIVGMHEIERATHS